MSVFREVREDLWASRRTDDRGGRLRGGTVEDHPLAAEKMENEEAVEFMR